MDFRDSQALAVLSSAGFGLAKLQELDEDTRNILAGMASGQGDRRKTIQMILEAAQKEVVIEPIQSPEVKIFTDGE